ncbi:DUF547 domain-containing protein [Pontixanthobacter aestiaquae]|uniref:DUF547 domain-containing protein n=1 Tax=Pontixanthobacter aestiaquae TaxID=1509367 RepID=A0A844Z8E7_9SPHN|nr:DUF547 domain-containing protein [Pontixanthobacter aestiaquae]MDN3644798.1 DUF547 domain-containing protein [Pontixanthobacter aestiaquae]MXO84195.1 DUF547 domain-containing protein [Pontixanthobacter aestiaquae]
MLGKTNIFVKSISVAALLFTGTALSAQTPSPQVALAQANEKFARFVPKAHPVRTKIDYSIWDEALSFFVVPMGSSIREGAPRVDGRTGTRRVYGHDSRFRLEGNRIGFSFFTDEVTQSLVEYRVDLQQTADAVNISTLSKNEQLAFWLNLHNVAIIEQIALQYPLSQPSQLTVGGSPELLDEAPFITVAGVAMSPKDIRTKIVYPNWKDPKVIYGFFRGDIGGPSIQREAFNGNNLSGLLDRSAREFINSLRGTDKSGKKLRVSKIFEEARSFYFSDWPRAIRAHYAKYANDPVKEIMDKTIGAEATIYETDIADLSNGERDPNLSTIEDALDNGRGRQGLQIPTAIARLMVERQQKIEKIIKRGGRQGTVTFVDVDLDGDGSGPEVVE